MQALAMASLGITSMPNHHEVQLRLALPGGLARECITTNGIMHSANELLQDCTRDKFVYVRMDVIKACTLSGFYNSPRNTRDKHS
jgi:hypothetical protein